MFNGVEIGAARGPVNHMDAAAFEPLMDDTRIVNTGVILLEKGTWLQYWKEALFKSLEI